MTYLKKVLAGAVLAATTLGPAPLAILVTTVSSTPAAAQTGSTNNAINGTITDTAHQPIGDLWIELLNEVDSVVKRTRTDRTGRYAFAGLSFGNFQVRVVTSGTPFAPRSERVTLYPAGARGGGSHYEQLDLVLRTAGDGKASDSGKGRVAFVQVVPDTARRAYERGVSLLDDHDVSNGMDALKEAIDIFPTYFLALERMGVEYVRQSKLDKAREVLTKALSVNPSGGSALYAIGVVHIQSKQWPEAADTLRRSLAIAPDSPNAGFTHYYLGVALVKTGKPSDAEPHLKRACELAGNNVPADAHMHLAQIYSNSKKYNAAADELELFLKQAPDARDAQNIRNIIQQLRSKAKAG